MAGEDPSTGGRNHSPSIAMLQRPADAISSTSAAGCEVHQHPAELYDGFDILNVASTVCCSALEYIFAATTVRILIIALTSIA